MNQNISFKVIDWTTLTRTEHPGEVGLAFWQTVQLEDIRVRIVEYTADFIADHWCQKGHIVHCLEGEFDSELENGETFHLEKGMTYIVSDKMSSHRSITKNGVRLLILDGNFLSFKE